MTVCVKKVVVVVVIIPNVLDGKSFHVIVFSQIGYVSALLNK
jgi:hypothetical protein